MTSHDPFRLKKVCADCPFRSDVPFHGLSADRIEEIAGSLRDGEVFHCHKTLDYDRADETGQGEGTPVVESSQMCAGALATMEKGGEVSQVVRVAERLGLYDPEEFDWQDQPVHAGLREWQEALREQTPL